MFRKSGSSPLSGLVRASPSLPALGTQEGLQEETGRAHGEELSVACYVSGFSANTATPQKEEQLR